MMSTFLLIVVFIWSPPTSNAEALHLMSNFSSISNKNHIDLQSMNERKHSANTWLIQHPFDGANPQSLGPPLNEDEPNDNFSFQYEWGPMLDPVYLPKAQVRGKAHLSALLFQQCPDSDTCIFTVPIKENTGERSLTVKLIGIDAPHLQGQCEQEVSLAQNAVELLNHTLSDAVQIDLYDHYKIGLHHEARLVADGQDLSQLLLNQGLAVPHQSERKEWCID